MSPIEIISLPSEQTETAIGVLARAFVTNPLHIAAFGPSRIDSNEAFFRVGLAAMKGEKLVAVDGPRILGFAHWVDSSNCQYSALKKLRMMPRMLGGLGLGSATKVISWVSTWARHDPGELHLHLGPIAVDPESQGRRIGSMLMERYCTELDDSGMAGFLETDRPENVDFYQRFGFVVTETAKAIGVETYFMSR